MKIGAIKFVDEYAGRALGAAAAPWLPARGIPGAPERILFVKFWGLGSIVLASPAVRAAHAAFPGATVGILTLAENEAVCDHLGIFDRVHTVRIDRAGRFLGDTLSALAAVRQERYDTIVDLELFAYVSALVGAASGAPRRLGFAKGARALFTETVAFDPAQHVVESFRRLAEALVENPLGEFVLTIPRPATAAASLESLLDCEGISPSDHIVAMNVNASALALERRWARPNFAAIAARLSTRFGAHIALTGSATEREYVAGLCEELPGPASVVNLAGRLSFPELVALIDRADLLVTNDSGPLHVASALDTPTAALFGPETPERYGPLASRRLVLYTGLACSPCMSIENRKTVDCRLDALCMRSMTVEAVWERLEPFAEGVLGAEYTVFGLEDTHARGFAIGGLEDP